MKSVFFILFALMLFPLTAQAQQVPPSAEALQLSFSPVVKKTSPAVVNIYAKRVVRERMRAFSPFFNDPFFSRFFDMQPGMGGPVQERIESSLGSGVIVDPSGRIATNTHVIKGSDDITVVLSDGREFDAEKILIDEKTDLAILGIDPKGEKLAHLDMADSDALAVGDLVLAIGNPFGVGQTVTSGIVSGLARTGVGPTDYRFFIQTDAAINPGNSGGALVDMQGRLVGINSMIFSRDGGFMGMGFAIPTTMVRAVLEASRHGGRIVRPWTGLSAQPLTADMAESLGLPRAWGALINKVHPQSPAARAGVRTGDVVTSVNGFDVQDPDALKFRLGTMMPGSDIGLKIWRGGKTIDVSVKGEAAPEIPPRDAYTIPGATVLSGATVMNLSPAVADEMGMDMEATGVVIADIAARSPAAQMGMRKGDILQSVNGHDTASVAALRKAVEKSAQQRRWQMQVQRGQQVINMVIGR